MESLTPHAQSPGERAPSEVKQIGRTESVAFRETFAEGVERIRAARDAAPNLREMAEWCREYEEFVGARPPTRGSRWGFERDVALQSRAISKGGEHMGRATDVINEASRQQPRPKPSNEAMKAGPRQTQPDGSVKIVEDWGQPAKDAPTVDRSPIRVTD